MTEKLDGQIEAVPPVAVVHASRAVRVTLFEDRAEVVRQAQVPVLAGTNTLVIGGVATMVHDPSLSVIVAGGEGRVVSTKILRRVREVAAASAAQIKQIESEQRASVQKRLAAERALELANTHEGRVLALLHAWTSALQRVPRAAGTRLAEWQGSYEDLSRAHEQALDDAISAQRQLQETRNAETLAGQRLTQARQTSPRFEAVVECQVLSDVPRMLLVELTYRTPCALWRPEHLCRVTMGADGQAQLAVTTWATAWQKTGEDWTNVALRFSTARPAQAATPPLLEEDNLRLRKKTDQERRMVQIELRDQAIASARLGRGQAATEEMPGVDDGGEPLTFPAPAPHTLLATGLPERVELMTQVLPCEVERVAYPERSGSAFLRVTATWTGTRPLLAGPVHAVREGELTGRGRVGYVAPGEPFELGFGVDGGLRLRRKVEESRDVGSLIGGQKISRVVKVYVSNLSGDRRRMTVVERVPVSEVSEIDVRVTPTSGMHFDSKDGFARFDVEVEPRGTRELVLNYRIEAASKVLLPSI